MVVVAKTLSWRFQILDADAAISQRLLERLPGQRLPQQDSCIQEQVTAIGPVQRARLDLLESVTNVRTRRACPRGR